MFLSASTRNLIKIPAILIWAQCFIFVALYSVWMIYELLYFRRLLLISGAVIALYPIYQYRGYLLQKGVIPILFMLGLFVWVLLHLVFLSHDYPGQLMELKRIWKYAGFGAIFAFGFGLSLASASNSADIKGQKAPYWWAIHFGLCLPILIYLIKFFLTIYGATLGITVPAYARINSDYNSAFYIPKTDYIAFCLPVLAISLGQIYSLLSSQTELRLKKFGEIGCYTLVIGANIFLFYMQNTKNGIFYAILCIALFVVLVIFKTSSIKFWSKVLFLALLIPLTVTILYPHLQKNDSWRTLIADSRIGLQIEKYPHWKDLVKYGYPNNEFGKVVSITNYERAAWFRAGVQLAASDPMGYGLVEDSFKRMAKIQWPDVGPNLTHSHSGWLDLVLGIGIPGVLCILGALIFCIKQYKRAPQPWGSLVFWALTANFILWITTEVAATVPFSALVFWICLACGLTLLGQSSHRNAINKVI